jgi:ABC-type dipeptide/oligopeptide/nickel transport system ATPase component
VSDSAVHVLVVCGASGTGKTVTMWEIGHRLQRRGVPHALIDSDELDRVWPQPEPVEALISVSRRHLRTMWETFSGLGTRRLVLCGVMASMAQSQQWIADAVPGATVTFIRLTADHATRERRLRGRELGSGFDQEMQASNLATDFIKHHDQSQMATVATDGKTVAQVADEVLTMGGW